MNQDRTIGSGKDSSCINVNRVYDCCKDRDCMMDMRVYLTREGQEIVDNASGVKAVSAEVLWTYLDVEPLAFNRGFYMVDIRFFFRVVLDVYAGPGRPVPVDGLCTYDKRVILFGSEGGAKLYSSVLVPRGGDAQLLMRTNLPKATVEVVDPVVLSAKLVNCRDTFGSCEIDLTAIPDDICRCFNSDIVNPLSGNKVCVTLGLFSIVRLMREVQIVVPCTDFCIPEKECSDPGEEDPCNIFYKMCFPIDEFFPPKPKGCGCEGNGTPDTRCCGSNR